MWKSTDVFWIIFLLTFGIAVNAISNEVDRKDDIELAALQTNNKMINSIAWLK